MDNINEKHLELFGRLVADYLSGCGDMVLVFNKVEGILRDDEIDLSKKPKIGEFSDWDTKHLFNMGVVWGFGYIVMDQMGKHPKENPELFIDLVKKGLFYAERFDFEFPPPYEPTGFSKALISTVHDADRVSEHPFNKGVSFSEVFVTEYYGMRSNEDN